MKCAMMLPAGPLLGRGCVPGRSAASAHSAGPVQAAWCSPTGNSWQPRRGPAAHPADARPRAAWTVGVGNLPAGQLEEREDRRQPCRPHVGRPEQGGCCKRLVVSTECKHFAVFTVLMVSFVMHAYLWRRVESGAQQGDGSSRREKANCSKLCSTSSCSCGHTIQPGHPRAAGGHADWPA